MLLKDILWSNFTYARSMHIRMPASMVHVAATSIVFGIRCSMETERGRVKVTSAESLVWKLILGVGN
jgi:hypothetical protein